MLIQVFCTSLISEWFLIWFFSEFYYSYFRLLISYRYPFVLKLIFKNFATYVFISQKTSTFKSWAGNHLTVTNFSMTPGKLLLHEFFFWHLIPWLSVSLIWSLIDNIKGCIIQLAFSWIDVWSSYYKWLWGMKLHIFTCIECTERRLLIMKIYAFLSCFHLKEEIDRC